MKKYIAIIMALIIASVTGCGSENTEVDISEDTADSTESAGPVSLTLWGAEEDEAMLSEMIESFKQKYGSEADITITFAAQSEAACRDAILGDIEGGADVFAFADDQLRTLVAAGALSKIPNASDISSSNVAGAVDASSVNGTLYAYPMTADNGYFMYYNKKYFSDSDLQTLDGMLKVAAENEKKITMDMTSGWYLYSFFGCTGLEVGLNPDGVTNYCTWNWTDNAIKGVDVVQAMLDIAGNEGFLAGGDDALISGAKDGSVIGGVSGVWNSNTLKEIWGDNLGAVKLPTYTCAGQQVQMGSFSGYKMVGVNDYSKNTEWAHKLASWITNEENQTKRFLDRGQGPSNNNAANSPEVAASPAIQAIIAQSEYASLQRIGGAYWGPTGTLGWTISQLNPSGIDLQEMIDTAVREITGIN